MLGKHSDTIFPVYIESIQPHSQSRCVNILKMVILKFEGKFPNCFEKLTCFRNTHTCAHAMNAFKQTTVNHSIVDAMEFKKKFF